MKKMKHATLGMLNQLAKDSVDVDKLMKLEPKKTTLTLKDLPAIHKEMMAAVDIINHPPHYNFGKYEVIDVIEDWQLGYHLGNVVKYVARAGKKNPDKEIEDLEKAKFYLERKIKKLKDGK
jgi:hypothetical protein